MDNSTIVYAVCYYGDVIAAFNSRFDADFYASEIGDGTRVFSVPVLRIVRDGADDGNRD